MKKLRMTAVSLASAGVLAAGVTGTVSAATPATASNGNVGQSGIPRTVFTEERQAAVAEVLNTTTANVQAAHKNHTLKQLVQNAGLTPKTFGQKVRAQLTSDLESKGYSQDQVTIALQHREIVRLKHHDHDNK